MGWWSTARLRTNMKKFWRGLGRVIFWSYERGSWPYDIMVVAIVVFVLLTPRKWFHDQPRSAGAARPGVELVAQNADSQNSTYRVNASMLPVEKRSRKSSPELERQMHDALDRNVPDLADRPFQVIQIDPVIDGDDAVLERQFSDGKGGLGALSVRRRHRDE